MSTWAVFLVLGVGTGAMYAALAMGVILIYRGSGVINFALGAMAMFPAVVYAELRTEGTLILPVVIAPNRVDLGEPMAFAPAALLALAVGLLVNWVIYQLVFRPLRRAAPLTLVIATVGLTITLQGLAVKAFGTASVRTPAILPQGTIELFGRAVPVDRFWLLGLVTLIALGLAVLYRLTDFGLATRAAATNEKGVTLLGRDAARVGLINWLLAATVVGSVGILTTSLGGVNPFNYSFFVVPALGAALAARLTSFSVALFAGVAIGCFETLTVNLTAKRQIPDFFLGGFSSLIPFLLIVLALVLVGRTLPNRATFLEAHLAPAPIPGRKRFTWTPFVVAAAALLWWGDAPLRLATIQSLFVITLLLSVVVLTGYLGQASLAQLAFAGFSAFTLSRLDAVPFPFGPLIAIALTTAVGTAIGLPALRIRGIQFAIVTFSAAFVFEQLLFRSPSFVGTGGIADVAPPSLGGLDLSIIGEGQFPQRSFGFFALVLTVSCALLVAAIRSGAMGRRFLAVRINERAAAAAGINVPRTKLLGAAVASFIASVAGVLFAYKSIQFNGGGLEAERGLELFALGYLGGIGSIGGAVIAGLIAPSGLVIALVSSSGPSENQFLATGVALLAVAVWLPGGLASLRPAMEAFLRRQPAGSDRPGSATSHRTN